MVSLKEKRLQPGDTFTFLAVPLSKQLYRIPWRKSKSQRLRGQTLRPDRLHRWLTLGKSLKRCVISCICTIVMITVSHGVAVKVRRAGVRRAESIAWHTGNATGVCSSSLLLRESSLCDALGGGTE